MHTVSAFGGTKRRRDSTVFTPGKSAVQMLSSRLSRLVKKNKQENPLHMIWVSAVTTPATVSTTTAIYDLAGQIAEGDAYNNRFGTRITLKRWRCNFVVIPSSTTPIGNTLRIVIFKAQSGTNLASTVVDYNTSSAVIANNNITRVFFDKMYLVGAVTGGTSGLTIKIDVKLNHPQHFAGSAAGTQTGDSIFFCIVGGAAAGATAPTIGGWHETWFQP